MQTLPGLHIVKCTPYWSHYEPQVKMASREKESLPTSDTQRSGLFQLPPTLCNVQGTRDPFQMFDGPS